MLFAPQMVLKSLECELEMKYILLLSSGYFEKTHSLICLFKFLPEDIKDSCKSICDSEEEFYKYLNEYSNTFIDFRYENDFQGIGSFEPWFLKQLADVLYNSLTALTS